MSPRGLIPFAMVKTDPGTSIWVNFVDWGRSLAAFTAGESQKQPSINRVVANVIFNFFIRTLLHCLTLAPPEIVRGMLGPFTVYCAKVDRLLRIKLGDREPRDVTDRFVMPRV